MLVSSPVSECVRIAEVLVPGAMVPAGLTQLPGTRVRRTQDDATGRRVTTTYSRLDGPLPLDWLAQAARDGARRFGVLVAVHQDDVDNMGWSAVARAVSRHVTGRPDLLAFRDDPELLTKPAVLGIPDTYLLFEARVQLGEAVLLQS